MICKSIDEHYGCQKKLSEYGWVLSCSIVLFLKLETKLYIKLSLSKFFYTINSYLCKKSFPHSVLRLSAISYTCLIIDVFCLCYA